MGRGQISVQPSGNRYKGVTHSSKAAAPTANAASKAFYLETVFRSSVLSVNPQFLLSLAGAGQKCSWREGNREGLEKEA